MFAKGMIVDFLLVVLLMLGVAYLLSIAKKGRPMPKIRRISGLDALSEGVGRATEMDRPVLYLPGYGDFSDPQLLASSAILAETARLTARYESRLIVPVTYSYVLPALQDLVKQSYLTEGKLENFKVDDVRWISDHYFGYAIGVIGTMFREQVATTVMIGNFAFDALMYAEAGHQAGAIQIGGTASTAQIPFFVAACDYALIGEEIFAAAAYLTNEPLRVATIVVEDYAKFVVTFLVVLGAILKTFGIDKWLNDLLSR